MRSFFALLALVGSLACSSVTAKAADNAEPVNPFAQPSPSTQSISASVSDDPEVPRQRGFSLPKLSLPKLPKPSLPKPSMPKLKLPKMELPKVSMPNWSKKEMPRNAGPSTWEKLNQGAKRMFAKTRNVLTPWAANDEPAIREAPGSRTRVASNRSSRDEPSEEKKSIFSSFLPLADDDEERVETTTDFLAQPRPAFN